MKTEVTNYNEYKSLSRLEKNAALPTVSEEILDRASHPNSELEATDRMNADVEKGRRQRNRILRHTLIIAGAALAAPGLHSAITAVIAIVL